MNKFELSMIIMLLLVQQYQPTNKKIITSNYFFLNFIQLDPKEIGGESMNAIL